MSVGPASETASAKALAHPLVLLGATATGKSELALRVAESRGAEILSVDASCVHRGLDVGTAKPGPEDRLRVSHHLIDVVGPDESLTAADWARMARAVLDDLTRRGVGAVLVGGTGLYLRTLLHDAVVGSPPDHALRARLEAREHRHPGSLHRLLRRLDPRSGAAIDRANVVRLVRALEHRLSTGRRLSDDQVHWSAAPSLTTVKVGLAMTRADRERRIRRRVEAMLAAGWIDEVRRLRSRGIGRDARSMRAIGYREIAEALDAANASDLDEAALAERIVIRTRQYAKRQDTWFRKEPGVTWLPAPLDRASLAQAAERIGELWEEGGAAPEKEPSQVGR